MVTIDLLCPNPSDGTSLYRGMGPYGAIAKNNPEVKVRLIDKADWTMCQSTDVLVAQRPFTEQHLSVVMMYRSNGAKVILDYDDWLLDIPVSNKAHDIYMNDGVKKNITLMLALADLVTVSTEALRGLMIHHMNQMQIPCPEIVVIPNALMFSVHGHKPVEPVTREDHKLILWRGTDTHVADVTKHLPGIYHTAKANPDAFWVFFGMRPWMLDGVIEDAHLVHIKPHDPIEYMQAIRDMAADVSFVTLDQCAFNLAKSNIAWLEACWAGALVVAPDWPEWQRPGIINFKAHDQQSFAEAMQRALAGDKDEVLRGQGYIRQHLLLSQVNNRRMDGVAGVLEGRFKSPERARQGRSSTATALDKHIRQALEKRRPL